MSVKEDITEQKVTMEALQESEERFRSAFECAAIGMVCNDDKGGFLQVNPAFCKMLGYSEAELLKLTIADITHPDDRKTSLDYHRKVLSGEVNLPLLEKRYICKDGHVIWGAVSVSTVNDVQGNYRCTLAQIQDINERKLAEDGLQRSEAVHRLTLSSISDAVFITDSAGRFTFVCPNVANIFGFSLDEVAEFNNIAALLGSDLFDSDELERSGEISNIEQTVTDKAGREHALLTSVKCVSIEEGSLLYTCRDITERKQAEHQLNNARQKLELNLNLLQSIIEAAPIRVFWKDRDSRYLGANSLFARDAGLSSPEEMIGKTDFEMVWKDHAELYRSDDSFIMETGVAKLNYVEPSITPKGEVIWLKTSKVPLCNDAQEVIGILGIYGDITKRKQAEEGHAAHLRFLENMERIDRVIRQATDAEQMMSGILQTTLDMFETDRAWLLYPCDPDAKSWNVPMERTRPEYPGALALGEDIPMLPEIEVVFRGALDKDGVITEDYRNADLPKETAGRFSILAQMYMAVYPRVGKPWLFGMHQCSHYCDWTDEEKHLFCEIGHRLGDSLSSLLFQRDLQVSEMRYRTLFESTTDAIMLLNDKAFFDCNEATLNIFGCKARDELLNKHPSELSPLIQPCGSDSMTLANERIAEAFMQGKNQFEWMYKRMDGTEFSADVWLTAMELDGKKILQATVRDITERKQAEEALRESKHNLILGQETAKMGNWKLYPETGEVECSDELLRIFGLTRDDISLKAFAAVVHPEDREYDLEHIQKGIEQGMPWDIEHRLLLKDGTVKWIHAVGKPNLDDNGKTDHIIGIVQDITEQKRVQDETSHLLTKNRRLTRRLMQSQEDERRYIAQELHDELGQSLTAIGTASKLISLRSKEEGVLDKANEIGQITSKLFKDIHSMLLTIRPPMLDSVGLSAALENMTAHWKVSTDIACTLNISGNPNDFPDAVNITIYRVLQECLTNISRHAMADEVKMSLCRVTRESESGQPEEALQLDVRDNGKGMNLEAPDAMGLGMVGMRERVQALGGSCVFNSSPGKGMHTSIMIPITMDSCEEC